MSNAYRRIFSGIQPTGIPHLGNYFGAISRWVQIAQSRKVTKDNNEVDCDTPIYSIVDVHAYSSAKTRFGQQLYDNLLSTTASLLALGLSPDNCILFKQSDILEHYYLDVVLDNFVSPSRLTRMTQFKEKSSNQKNVFNSLLNYPILQAADILVYRADLVPVGEDQLQHLELTRDMARNFNAKFECNLLIEPEALLEPNIHARRVKSLRQPQVKMSKSDADVKSYIQVTDEADIVLEKCKKSITDCTSAVYYNAEKRPGVSNLMRIYSMITSDSLETITDKFRNNTTAEFKLKLADAIIDRFSDTRQLYKRLRADRAYLEEVLNKGASKARPIAQETIWRVKQTLGSIG